MITYTIYVVDDEESIRDAAQLLLTEYQVRTFPSAEDVIAHLAHNPPPDLMLMDIGLPGMSGVEAMRRIRADHPQVLFIMITAYEDVETVVAAMKEGARDYLVKPLRLESLKRAIANALETIRLRKEVQALQARYLEENLPCFVGESDSIQDVLSFVKRVAASADAPVLIVGPTGSGKELVAGAIHFHSPHFAGPLVSLNCAAIPKELVESELFGYEGGAFSGARSTGKKGLVEQAHGGTLFLDEVGDLSLEAQAKLLRFLDAGEHYRVGGTKKLSAQVRVVSATNRDLPAMVAQGLFRQDLYYRLAVLKVEVPALNRRPEDILALARHFLLQLGQKYGKAFSDISPQAQAVLRDHPWEGNVRELKAVIERGVLAGRGPLLEEGDLGLPLAAAAPAASASDLPALGPQGMDLAQALDEIERGYIVQALDLAQGSDVKAAHLLGLNYHTFRYRRRRLGL